MPVLRAIYASTSGHTAYVIDILARYLAAHAPAITVELMQAEKAGPQDLLSADMLLLGSGTWNTGGKEGQLNMYMHALLFDRCAQIDLGSKPVALISLGDERYYFTTRCTEHFIRFLKQAHGRVLPPPLTLVNEPYGQEERIERWAAKLLAQIHLLPSFSHD